MVLFLVCLPFCQNFGIFSTVLLISFWWIRKNGKKHSSCFTKKQNKNNNRIIPHLLGALSHYFGKALGKSLLWALGCCGSAPASCLLAVLQQLRAMEVAPVGGGGHWESPVSLGFCLCIVTSLWKMLLSVISAANWWGRNHFWVTARSHL